MQEHTDKLLQEKEVCVPDMGGVSDQSMHASTKRSEDNSTDHTISTSDLPSDTGGD